MAEATFGITYDGPALASGRMPVRELAPALLALGNLFTLASDLLEPELPPVAVSVQATEQGSFVVKLLLEADALWGQIVGIFGSKDANALEVLASAGAAVFGIAKTIGRRRVARASHIDAGTVRLTLDDGSTIEVPGDAWTLYKSVEIRKYTRDVVAPVRREGVDLVSLDTSHDDERVTIDKDDLDGFNGSEDDEDEPLLDTEQEMFVEIVAPTFVRGNKWRLSLGEFVFWAAVADDNFLDQVEAGERFGKGDMLRCWVRIEQTRDLEGLHTEYTILQVREHLPRHVQLRFDPEDAAPPDEA